MFKRLTAILTAAIMTAMPVMAGDINMTEGVVDTTQKCSFTLHKLIDNDGNMDVASGLVNENEDRLPLDDVVFSYKKIADMITVSGVISYDEGKEVSGESSVGVYFTNLDENVASIMQQAASAGLLDKHIEFENDDTIYFTTEQVEYYLDLINDFYSDAVSGETLLLDYLKTTGTEMEPTVNGSASASDLDQGLYLVGETDISAHDGLTDDMEEYLDAEGHPIAPNPEEPVVETPAMPFLVCLPTTNVVAVDGKTEGTQWIYDVNVYPKDSTNAIYKRIVDPDETEDRTLRTREDYQIGDTIEQVIYADAPKLREYTQDGRTYKKTHKKFAISDTMTEGLTVDEITSVAICDKQEPKKDTDFMNGNYQELTKEDYTVSDITADPHHFTVTLTEKGLLKLDAIERESQVVVWFKSTLNKAAKIGEEVENENHPTLTWKNSNTNEREYDGNPVKVYTYELDLTKKGLTDSTKATFKVKRTDSFEAQNDVKFIEDEAGRYHVFDEKHGDSEASIVYEMHPAADGSLKVSGLDSNTYEFTETKTEGGLADNAEENGKDLLKTVFDVNLVAPDPGESECGRDGIFTPDRNGTLDEDKTTASVNDNGRVISTSLKTKESNGGIALLSVNNYKTITLRTGGQGRTAVYVLGFAMASLLGFIAIKRRKLAR